MAIHEISNKIRPFFEASLVIDNNELGNVLIAINSSKDKTMIDEDIQTLTNFSKEKTNNCINLLERMNYITSKMEDVSGRSPHKICTITDNGKKVLKALKIE